MNKILKWLGIAIGAVVLVIIIAGVVIIMVVNKDMIAAQMEKSLNRQAAIGAINVSIFSVVSGIEVNDVKISNFKTPRQLAALKGKPVASNDIFVALKSFRFKLRFLPLLSKQVSLKEIMLYEPVINVVRYKSGLFNFSDLTAPKAMTPEEKQEMLKEQKETVKKKAEEAKKPQKPLTADDLPLEIAIGKIGMEKGKLTFLDQSQNQSFQAYNLTAMVHSIKIDAKDLANKNSVALKIEMGLKTIGQITTGSVKSFDIGMAVTGQIKPFDTKTRILDPEATLKIGSTYGSMTGLQIFEKMKSVESLSKYCGKLSFLKDNITWKDAFVNVWYKGGTVKLSDGKIKTSEFNLAFSGKTNINTKALDMDMDMVLAKKHTASIRSGVLGNVKTGLKAGGLDKYAKPEKVADTAMKPLVNKDGDVDLVYKVTGTMSSPNTQLVSPKLPSMKDIIKEAAGDVKGMAEDKAKQAVNKEADKAKEQGKEKAKSATKDLLKKKKLF